MSHEYRVADKFQKAVRDIREEWSIFHHLVRDPRQADNKGRYRHLGVHKCLKLLGHLAILYTIRADLRDPGVAGLCSGRLEVEHHKSCVAKRAVIEWVGHKLNSVII